METFRGKEGEEMDFLLSPAKWGTRSAAVALLLSSPLVFASPSQALEYKFGDLQLYLDTTISVSAAMRAGKQSCTHISVWNGGCPGALGQTFSENDDDGNVNVERGEIFSSPVKVISELSGQWENYGFYISGKAFYDHAVRNLGENQDGNYGPLGTAHSAGNIFADPQRRPLRDPLRGDAAYDAALSDIKLLDAYAYGNWDVANMPLNVRLGRQVVSWGESTFIQGGVSSYLPLDVAALYQPGLELKEVFLPQGTAYASLGLPANITLEAMYVFEHEKSELPACGTLFSVSDVLGTGCAYAVSKGEVFLVNATGELPILGTGFPLGQLPSPLVMRRTADEGGGDQGQYGVALRYYADWMGQGTDWGFYFVNFHSKLPFAEFTANSGTFINSYNLICGGNLLSPACGTIQPTGWLDVPPGPIYGYGITPVAAALGLDLAGVTGGAYKTVHAYYPEDIKMIGASFNTSVTILPEVLGDGSALSGELAYYPNMPFQVDPLEINAHDFAAAGFTAQPGEPDIYTGQIVGPGEWIPGSRETAALHGSLTTISTLTPSHWFVKNSGGDFAALVMNVGFQYLPDGEGNRFSTPMNSSHANPGVANAIGDVCISAGLCPGLRSQYADTFSWGYRLYGYQDYHSAFGTGVTLSPKIMWSHDVKGYSAGPIGPGFVEGKQVLMLGVDATYQSYKVGLSYTTHMGAKDKNKDYDKDFVAVTASVAF